MKILIIRRDNIGDLILTTPLISTIAKDMDHKVDLLVNTYNQSIIENNPHIGEVFLYNKLHRRSRDTFSLKVLFQRPKTIIDSRRAKYDIVIITKEHWDKRPLQWAKLAGARRIVAIGNDYSDIVTGAIPKTQEQLHLVNLLNRLTGPLDYTSEPGPLELYVTLQELADIKAKIELPQDNLPVYRLQISPRKEEQQWQKEKFVKLAHKLATIQTCRIMLFWSLGKSNNKLHPGNDDEADLISAQCADLPIIPVRTDSVCEPMVSTSLRDQIVTSDGGVLYVAAGVHKPVVVLFGNKVVWLWTPWGVPHEMLQGKDYDTHNISVDGVFTWPVSLQKRVRKNTVMDEA